MTTRLRKASSALFTRLCRGAGVSGRYVTHEKKEVELDLIPGNLQLLGVTVEEIPLIDVDRSWLVQRSQLVVDSEAVTPRSGHWIIVEGKRHKVLPPAQGEKCYQSLGNDEEIIRVFTKDWGKVDE